MASLRARNPFATARAAREVINGIWLLGSHRVNFYAIAEGRSVTLVDAGFYGHLRYLTEWLAATGRSIGDVEAIVITHGHADHLGFAGDFDRRGVPVYVHERDLEVARTTRVRRPPVRMRRNLWRPSTARMLAEGALDSVFTQPPVPGARSFRGDQQLDVPGRLRAVHVPGHSPGNCSLHHPALDAMFTGDTLMTLDPMFGGEGPLVFSEHPRNDALCLDNLALLRPFASARLLPAHGEPDTTRGALGAAIAHARIAKPGRAGRCSSPPSGTSETPATSRRLPSSTEVPSGPTRCPEETPRSR